MTLFHPKKRVTGLLNLTTNTTLSMLSLLCCHVALPSLGRKPVVMPGELWEVRRAVLLLLENFQEDLTKNSSIILWCLSLCKYFDLVILRSKPVSYMCSVIVDVDSSDTAQ